MAEFSDVYRVMFLLALTLISSYGIIASAEETTAVPPENADFEEEGDTDVECSIWCWMQKALIWFLTNVVSRFF